MVFCKECKQKVEECPHFVDPIRVPRIKVLDEKIETLAYSEPERILEITYRNGQVWQLFPVPSMYGEIRDTTLWSFIRFMAQRYKAAPVRIGLRAIVLPSSIECPKCKEGMTVRSRMNDAERIVIQLQWECKACGETMRRNYDRTNVGAKRPWH